MRIEACLRKREYLAHWHSLRRGGKSLELDSESVRMQIDVRSTYILHIYNMVKSFLPIRVFRSLIDRLIANRTQRSMLSMQLDLSFAEYSAME